MLDALRALHQVQLVHGDLKPDNIFLTKAAGTADHVKLVGFGLGRSVTAETTSEDPWGPDQDTSINSPAYLSPEQAFGKKLDHRTDIYSFGVILYQLLCGRLPYGGRNLAELLVELEMDSPPPAPRHLLADPVGRALESIARRCLEKDPARRWPNVGELKDALDALASGRIPPLEEASDADDRRIRTRVGRSWLVAAALAVVLVVIGGFFLYR